MRLVVISDPPGKRNNGPVNNMLDFVRLNRDRLQEVHWFLPHQNEVEYDLSLFLEAGPVEPHFTSMQPVGLEDCTICTRELILAMCSDIQAKPPEQIYKDALPSVLTLMVEKKDGTHSQGSAFLAMDHGLAVTAWHVVEGARRVVARFATEEEFEVSGIVDKDEKRDLAIIRVKVYGRPLMKMVGDDPEVGSKAYVIGAPEGLEYSISDGLVSQVRTVEGVKVYQFTCPASPGSSGGPLVMGKAM